MSKIKPTRSGNPASLIEHKSRSVKTTRERLELALTRILDGKSKFVSPGMTISALAVAKEAKVDRSTLYRYHPDFLAKLKCLTNSKEDQLLESKLSELLRAQARSSEYKNIAENLQIELELIARNNYALSNRAKELEELVRQRDVIIANLKMQLKNISAFSV